jgi:Ca2+-binding EF-hand superfamily protein
MGCTESKDLSLLERLRESFPKTLAILELQQYSQTLATAFLEVDKNGNLALDMGEFFNLCGIPRNRVSERLFAIVDMDGSGTLDFREACYAVWQLCTLDQEGLQSFLFDLYDEFNNGTIEYDDVERMLKDSYGGQHSAEVKALVAYVKEKGVLGRLAFVDFCDRCPQVLKQVVDVQKRTRLKVLGNKVWAALEQRRARKTDPYFRPENWNLLMERLIMMDIEAREEAEHKRKEQEKIYGKRSGAKLSHVGGEERIRYEP